MRSGLLMGTFMTAMFAVGGGGTANIAQPTSPISVDGTGSSTQPPSGSSSCVASQAQWAVGQRASDDLLARARVDAGAALARFLRPNQPITLEYSGVRLNLHLNPGNVVLLVTCG